MDLCNVDGINMDEYLEGTCHVTEAERYGCDDEDDDYYYYDPEPLHDEALRQVLADALDKAQPKPSGNEVEKNHG